MHRSIASSAGPAIRIVCLVLLVTHAVSGTGHAAPPGAATTEADRPAAAANGASPAARTGADADDPGDGASAPERPGEDPAGATAPSSPTAVLQAELEQESTRARERLERIRRSLADAETETWRADVRRALDRAAGLRIRLTAAGRRSVEADRTHEETIDELRGARTRLREALDALDPTADEVPVRSGIDLDSLRASSQSDRVAALESMLADIERESRALDRAMRRARWDRVQAWADVVRRLNAIRIDALDRITPARREEVLGISRAGFAQFQREIEHLRLMAEVYAHERWRGLQGLGDRIGDVFTLGRTVWTLLKIALVLVAFGLVWRAGPKLDAWAARVARDPARGARTRRRFETARAVARVVAPWLLLLAVVGVLARVAGPAADWPEATLLRRLAVLYLLYRLSIDVLVGACMALVRRHRLEVGAVRAAKLLRSVRFVLRVAFGILLLLTLSSRFLGEGYLYHVVHRATLGAMALALLRVFLWWREDIIAAYLEHERAGWLRQRVEDARDRWYAGFLAAGALTVLAGRVVVTLTRDFALGFDQTRRALAFLFRRRVEKHAERVGYAEPRPTEPLPPRLVEALTEDPVTEPDLVIDHFPGMDQLERAFTDWRDHDTGGSVLLTGDYGVGRTSWLQRVPDIGLPSHRVTFRRRIDSDATLAQELGAVLGFEDAGDCETLARRLAEGPPRIVIVDRGQNLFLGRVGGYAGFESFVSLVEDTLDRVFWIVSFSRLSWEHIAAVHPQLATFRTHIVLEPWSEERIRELIRQRVRAAGVTVSFDDLLLEALEGLPRRVRDREIEESYARLLWDHTLGLPRVALHYWRRSLVADEGGRIRVRLFRTPRVEDLEQSGDIPAFLLAAIFVHESLTLDEIAVVTRYPERLCRIHVLRLGDLGVIRRDGERYWVTSYWIPVVARMLKRRNLLSD